MEGGILTSYALWYFKPLGGNYAIFDTNVPTSELSDLGFDYMIALHAPGKDGEYGQMPMSGYSYDDGYNDGKNLAQWIEREVNPGLPYLVEIPVLVKTIYGTDITNLSIMENYCSSKCKYHNCGDVNGYVF